MAAFFFNSSSLSSEIRYADKKILKDDEYQEILICH